MIYKLIVNAAFLAIGYYIGKEVGLDQKRSEKTGATGMSKPEDTNTSETRKQTGQ